MPLDETSWDFLDRPSNRRQRPFTSSPLLTMSVAKYANLPYIVRDLFRIGPVSRFG